MSKRIALKDLVECDNVDLSTFARSVDYQSEHEDVDVSGFNALGTDESLAGKTAQSVTVEFFMSDGAGEVHQTLYGLHKNRTLFDFAWRIDQTLPVSPTNPECRGTVQLLTYPRGATRGDVEVASMTFKAADENGLIFYET